MSAIQPIPTPTPVQAVSGMAAKTHNEGTIFPLAARATGEYASDPFVNPCWLGARFFLNLTVVGGAGTVTFKIQNQDPVSRAWVDVPEAVTTALAAVALTTFTMYPGVEEDANVHISNPLGNTWRAVATVGGNDVTFSVGGVYLE
jgi:hypothetical protein